MAKNKEPKAPAPREPEETEPAPPRRISLYLDEVGDYMKKHGLRLVRIVDKDGTVVWPKQ